MRISRLAVDDYRSWSSLVVDLDEGVTILQGRNGLGKTNLVEALEVLSTGSSHRVSSSAPLVRRGRPRATVRANAEQDGRTDTYELTIPLRGANRARIDGGPSLYMRDLVGKVPSVTFSPEDQRLVTGEPSGRRSFLDQTAVQLDPDYYRVKQETARLAQQRGALLKRLARSEPDPGGVGMDREAELSGLEVWTGQFIQRGMELTARRMKVVEKLAGPLGDIYRNLAGEDQVVEMAYLPSFAEVLDGGVGPQTAAAISRHFQRVWPGEQARGVNLLGPQRDDLEFSLNGMPARDYASNGEEWTLALALRLAEHRILAEASGLTPILVLDDVFAQLDERRRSQIIRFVQDQPQTLITAASPGDVPDLEGAHLIDIADLADRQRQTEAGVGL
ncbi:DNA replication/repair protein RecF [Bifidobacterium xylocopae]|uniref:DNA replication and repair protein RecF n=1 Tax=Bifidobacterium xylocopae TaxID=2493119 RepID=A0A366KG42_9BIFI|nr:DNA replication/repair protein RecF [Bifidobacterium xylocopae]RBP99661.1 DNA replication and repair protein RecF [Bifidobacterium xylocopae]